MSREFIIIVDKKVHRNIRVVKAPKGVEVKILDITEAKT